MVFAYASPSELVLEIDPSVQEQADRQSQQHPQTHDRSQIYLNELCLNTVLPWLQTDYSSAATLWLGDELPALWSIVNGTAIAIGNKRLVLIPHRQFDTQTLTVAQEWVDIPEWAGDYFLAIQIDPVERWLRIWGYTTHEQLKTQGTYDAGDRTYALDATLLIADITALSVVYQLNPNEQTQVAISPLPTLSGAQAQTLLQTLADAHRPSFRHVLSFQEWAELLRQPATRQRIYALRRDALKRDSSTLPLRPPIQLLNWLQQQFEQHWQSVETLFQAQPPLASSLRHGLSSGEIRRAHPIALAPDHQVLLVIALDSSEETSPDAPPSPNVLVRLYPGDRPLPENLTLALLSTSGEVVQQVQATEQAEFIQLKRFRCRPGKAFQIQVAVEQPIFSELFVS